MVFLSASPDCRVGSFFFLSSQYNQLAPNKDTPALLRITHLNCTMIRPLSSIDRESASDIVRRYHPNKVQIKPIQIILRAMVLKTFLRILEVPGHERYCPKSVCRAQNIRPGLHCSETTNGRLGNFHLYPGVSQELGKNDR